MIKKIGNRAIVAALVMALGFGIGPTRIVSAEKADKVVEKQKNVYENLEGELDEEQKKVISGAGITTVSFKKEQYTVPYSWYKTITPDTSSPS